MDTRGPQEGAPVVDLLEISMMDNNNKTAAEILECWNPTILPEQGKINNNNNRLLFLTVRLSIVFYY